MTPTETLAKLLEESGAKIVLPNEEIKKAFAALEATIVRLTQERDAARDDRERLDWLEKTVIHQSRYEGRDVLVMHDDEDGIWISTISRRETTPHIPMDNEPLCVFIREALDAARKAGA